MEQKQIKWEIAFADKVGFSYMTEDDDGNQMRRRGSIQKCIVVVSVPHAKGIDKIAFSKVRSSRGQSYKDSRNLAKTQAERDMLSELVRLLGNTEGNRAMEALKFL